MKTPYCSASHMNSDCAEQWLCLHIVVYLWSWEKTLADHGIPLHFPFVPFWKWVCDYHAKYYYGNNTLLLQQEFQKWNLFVSWAMVQYSSALTNTWSEALRSNFSLIWLFHRMCDIQYVLENVMDFMLYTLSVFSINKILINSTKWNLTGFVVIQSHVALFTGM